MRINHQKKDKKSTQDLPILNMKQNRMTKKQRASKNRQMWINKEF